MKDDILHLHMHFVLTAALWRYDIKILPVGCLLNMWTENTGHFKEYVTWILTLWTTTSRQANINKQLYDSYRSAKTSDKPSYTCINRMHTCKLTFVRIKGKSFLHICHILSSQCKNAQSYIWTYHRHEMLPCFPVHISTWYLVLMANHLKYFFVLSNPIRHHINSIWNKKLAPQSIASSSIKRYRRYFTSAFCVQFNLRSLFQNLAFKNFS